MADDFTYTRNYKTYISLGVKRPGREDDHSYLVPRLKNELSYTSTSPIRLQLILDRLMTYLTTLYQLPW